MVACNGKTSEVMGERRRACSTVEKEPIALMLAIKQFRFYVSSGDKIVFYLEHNPLAFKVK